MPSAKKVAWAQLRVGIMTIAALVILAVLVFLLTGEKKLFARDVTIFTYLDDSAALTSGAPVRLNGILVGEVSAVELSGSNDPRRIVRVAMSIRQDRIPQIPVDSVTTIAAENVLGTKYINIKKGTSATPVRPDGELQSLDTRAFDEVVQASYNILASLQGVIKRVDGILDQVEAGKGTIGKFLVDEELYKRLVATTAEMQKVTQSIASGRGTVGKLLYDEGLYNDVRASVQRFDSLLADMQAGEGTAGRFLRDPALYNEARATVAEFRRLIDDLNAGKGTAGKLLKDEALYKQIQATLVKLDATVDRLNSGQGTLGQLVVNPALYDSLNGATNEIRSLVKEIRANPSKYLRIKLGLF